MDKQIQSTNNRNLLPYIWVVARQHFKVIAGLILLGAVVAAGFVYIRGTVYKSEASFIADPSIVLSQVERLDSRDILIKAIQRLNFVQTEYYQMNGIRGEFNLYDQTPFVVHISNFPEHLLGMEMQIVFEKDGKYVFSFDSEGHSLEKEGRPGVALDLGSISFVVELTRYWSEKWADKTLNFRVHSESDLASDFREKLSVTHLLIRKNRIKVEFKDANRRRALDMMEALADVVLEEWESTNNKYIEVRLERIQRELDYLFAEMGNSKTLAQFLTQSSSNFKIDSLAAMVKWQEERLQSIGERQNCLKKFEKAGYAVRNFKEKFAPMVASAIDSSLLDLIAVREGLVAKLGNETTASKYKTVSFQIAGLVDKIQMADSLLASSLHRIKDDAEFMLVSNSNIRKNYLLGRMEDNANSETSALQWNTYLGLLSDRNRVTGDLMSDQKTFGILDSPHLVKQVHRLRQARDIFSGMALGGILGMLYVLGMAFLANRISSVAQLNMMTELPLVAHWKSEFGSMHRVVRELRVALELQRQVEDRVIAIGSEYSDPMQGILSGLLAKKYKEIGLKMKHLKIGQGADGEISSEKLAIRLLSPEIGLETSAALVKNDLVLMDLPSFADFPETWLKIRASKQLIYLVYAQESRYKHLKALEKKAAAENLQVLLVFVS